MILTTTSGKSLKPEAWRSHLPLQMLACPRCCGLSQEVPAAAPSSAAKPVLERQEPSGPFSLG